MEKPEFDLKTELISDAVINFAVGFAGIQDDDRKEQIFSVGSGTFVSIGSIHGILTAAHVLEALPQSGSVGIVLNCRDPSQFRRLVIEMERTERVLLGGKASGAKGPDLGFLRLFEVDVGRINALAAFYNLSRREYVALAEVRSAPNYVDAILGIVDEHTTELPPINPRVTRTNFVSIFVDGLSDPTENETSFDVFDFEPTPRPDFDLPSDYRGVSGGAVWRFDIDLKSTPPKVVQKVLLGVPFHQSDLKNGKRIITCHGPRSIYARLFDKIREQWPTESGPGSDFIRDIVQEDLLSGRRKSVVTRFPPEPNGYLHIGHAKSICLNFGIADEFGGHCNLRYDDTNPTKESQEYIDAIERDVRWLGFDWGAHLYHASDYFERLYGWAEDLIRAGKAYVDDQSQDEMRAARGTLTEPGKNSPFRDRGIEESLDLFRRMRTGEFPNGARVLRAKIDMASGNINLRDPVLYRILHAEHPRTGKTWSIYPSYDFAHGQSDAIEGITHSLCTLEFEDHRPLYDWFLQNLPVPSKPHQYEFARLNLTYTILSKRVLTELVRGGHVHGWDDPRMPTLAGLRRRGVPPEAIRDFVKRIGVAKANSVVDMGMLEFSIREHLNGTAQRRMAVLRPLKVVIENYPDGQSEEVEAVNHPEDAAAGTRRIRFGRELYIERDDFMENPPKKFFRLSPGTEVRLRYAYFITCREVVKNASGEIVELRCTYDPATKGGNAPDGRKVKATMHWVSAQDSIPAEVRLYNPLFTRPDPNAGDFAADINPNSLEVISDARVEPALAGRNSDAAVQFERLGYFCPDKDSTPEWLVFNRTVGLRDTWAKVSGGGSGGA
jgi:glutaminyl-tRNA synthetase